MKRVAAVVGDYYHRAEESGEALQQALRTWAGASDVSLRFVDAGRIPVALAETPDAVVLFKEDRVAPQEDENARWMTAAIAEAIAKYVEQGGGWLAWHSGLASYEPEGTYVSMLRGRFLFHPALHQTVRYTAASAEAGRDILDLGGKNGFEALDEHYFVECDRGRTEVFLLSESVDGNSIAGWRHPYGHGRICCLTPAHTREGLFNPDFLRVLGSAVRWCCGE
ncbi:trehalose utilization [Cohnella sp. CFH 77786]|uniref:ThuA domain-containing protein n=1 Tax=Cohnella sp. CFH 77786 TaxID=2662265 RepID=UPI001C60912C|nr:ThuA domain-containing protein [Cohnella sp. CFH 77786]MBW5447470.1 trehalose utilization [Cohnella sp. CFH 77786]